MMPRPKSSGALWAPMVARRMSSDLSDPPTRHEQLQLLAAKRQGTPIAIMPHKYTMEEWVARYGRVEDH
jgi:hypothetical protein